MSDVDVESKKHLKQFEYPPGNWPKPYTLFSKILSIKITTKCGKWAFSIVPSLFHKDGHQVPDRTCMFQTLI